MMLILKKKCHSLDTVTSKIAILMVGSCWAPISFPSVDEGHEKKKCFM